MLFGSARSKINYPILPTLFLKLLRSYEAYLGWWGKQNVYPITKDDTFLEQLRSRRAFGWKDFPFKEIRMEILAEAWKWVLKRAIYFDSGSDHLCGICGTPISKNSGTGGTGLCYGCYK